MTTPDLSKASFYSQSNIMKRMNSVGRETQFTYVASALGVTTANITHGLGYEPFYIVGVELFNDGILWSTNYLDEYSSVVYTGGSGAEKASFTTNTTSTTLTITITNGNTGFIQTGTRIIRYGVYHDYST